MKNQGFSMSKCFVAKFALGLLCSANIPAIGQEVVIDFENAPIRLDPNDDEKIQRLELYTSQGVEFKLARQPEKSKAKGKIMFFPHLGSQSKGLLNAMAEEQEIPVQVRFPWEVSRVTIRFWASTGAAAKLEAFDRQGTRLAVDEIKVVPSRKRPEDSIPKFELSVSGNRIGYVEFSGPRTGEYLAADEVRIEPMRAHD